MQLIRTLGPGALNMEDINEYLKYIDRATTRLKTMGR